MTVPLKSKNATTIKDSFENILINSKSKLNLIQSDIGREFYNSIFQSFLNNGNFKVYSRNTSLGAVFAEKFNRIIRDLHKNLFSKKERVPIKTKQYNNGIHSSTKLTPIQAPLKKTEGYVYHKLLDKRNKRKSKFQVNDLVRTADLRRTFSKANTNIWSDKLYKNPEIIVDTIPNYKIDNLKKKI